MRETAIIDAEHGFRRHQTHGGDQRDGHAFGGVVGEGVRYLVTHDLGEFVVGQSESFEQTAVDRHPAPGHAPGIDGLGLVYEGDAPLPVGGVRVARHRLANDAAGDSLYAIREQRIVQQTVFSG